MFKIKNSLASANIPKTIRFTEKLDECLCILSQKNNTSFNSMVLQCCEYALENLQEDDTK